MLKGMKNQAGLLKKAMKAQKDLEKVQKSFKGEIFERSYAQDKLKLVMDGEFTLKKLEIDPLLLGEEADKKDDLDMLQDSLLYAFNSLYKEVDDFREAKLKTVTAGMSLEGFGL